MKTNLSSLGFLWKWSQNLWVLWRESLLAWCKTTLSAAETPESASTPMEGSLSSCHWPCFVTGTSAPYLVLVRTKQRAKAECLDPVYWHVVSSCIIRTQALTAPINPNEHKKRFHCSINSFIHKCHMKGSGIKDLCHGVAWKTSPKPCCSFGNRYNGTYCLFNLGLSFLELYAVKIVLCS